MTNILVPTDFSAASLKIAEGLLKNEGYTKCNIILFHAFELPSSPFDLLGTRYKDPACELMTEAFRLACKQLKDEYPKEVGKIIVRCMKGNTKALFRNFVDANDVDLICCPEDYVFVPVHERSVDPLPLFKKCGVPVVKTSNRKATPVFNNPVFGRLQVSAQ